MQVGPLIAIPLDASRSADRHPAGCKKVGPLIAIPLDASRSADRHPAGCKKKADLMAATPLGVKCM
jgi:hypothetical protein